MDRQNFIRKETIKIKSCLFGSKIKKPFLFFLLLKSLDQLPPGIIISIMLMEMFNKNLKMNIREPLLCFSKGYFYLFIPVTKTLSNEYKNDVHLIRRISKLKL